MSESPKAYILKNHLSPGDVLCMTAAVHCLHKLHPGKFLTAVDTTCPALWEHNPDVVPAERAREAGGELVETNYGLINQSNQRAVHVLQGYCDYLTQLTGVPVPLLTNRPHVYLSEEEKGWMNQAEQEHGVKQPFWLVNAGVKQDYTCKQWPYYQEVITALQGKVLFVQVGRPEHVHRPLAGALNLIGRTDDRQLLRLVYHSRGVLCGTTYLMHLAAALEKPAVVLAGGREPRNWNCYPLQTLFSTVGALPCCLREACWRSRTVKLGDGREQDNSLCDRPTFTEPVAPQCMAMIRPEEVAEAILRYQT